MDDIATPGSFWLNPPHPRDDEGNAVDPILIMERYEMTSSNKDEINAIRNDGDQTTASQNEEVDDDYLAAILADMDPL